MDDFMVKAQIAAAEAEAAMQKANFRLVYNKYEEAASLYSAALRRAIDVKTQESLKQLQAHYAEKARHISEYLDSDASVILENEQEEQADSRIDYDTSNLEDYYNYPMPSSDPDDMERSEVKALPPVSNSPLDKLVVPLQKGYETVRNFVYSASPNRWSGALFGSNTPGGMSSGSNSLEESFFFIPSDEGPSVGTSPTEYQLASRAGTSPYHVDVAGPRGHSASSGRNMIASDLGGSPGSGSAGSAGAVARSPRDTITVDRSKLAEVMNELAFMRGLVTKLRDQNAKLLQQSNTEGMHTLVRENTQLKKSIVQIQRQRNDRSTMPWDSGIAGAEARGYDTLPELGSSVNGGNIHAETDIAALRAENARLRGANEQLEKKMASWREKWDKLKATALERKRATSLSRESSMASLSNVGSSLFSETDTGSTSQTSPKGD